MEACEIIGAICALGGCGITSICWLLWRPLESAEKWDKEVVEGTKDVKYIALPIYGYLRRYLVGLLTAGVAIILISVVGTIFATVLNNCDTPSAVITWVIPFLLALFCIHITAISIYENDRRKQDIAHRERMPKKTKEFVKVFRNRLWTSGLLLLLIVVAASLAAISSK